MTGRPGPDAAAAARRVQWIRRLALGVVLVSVLGFAVATTGVQIHLMPPRTDFATYYLAGMLARERHSPYDQAAIVARGHAIGFTHEQYPYLYPPAFALAMQPFTAAPFARARQTWMLIMTTVLILAAGTTVFLLRAHVRALRIEYPAFSWILLAAAIPTALDSASVHSDIRLGSVGIVLWWACAAAAWGLLRGRQAVVGVALALATMVKLTPAVFLAWAWWRGERRAALLGGALLALALLPALGHWGPGILADYWHQGLVPTLRAQIGWTINQSLDAFVLRLFVPGAMLADPARAPWAKTVLSAALNLAVVLWTLRVVRRRPRDRAGLVLEFGYLWLALLVVMKVTWVHTLAAMLFVWPLVMAELVRAAERGARWTVRVGLVACAGFFLSSAHFPVLWNEKFHHGAWILCTGVHLYGLLVLWAATGIVLERRAASIRG